MTFFLVSLLAGLKPASLWLHINPSQRGSSGPASGRPNPEKALARFRGDRQDSAVTAEAGLYSTQRHSCPAALDPQEAATQHTFARLSCIPCADNHQAKSRLGIVTELVLGGPREVALGRASLLPSRSTLSVFSFRCSPTTVARAFLPDCLLPTPTRNAAHLCPSLIHSVC